MLWLPASIPETFGGFGEYSALTSALYLEELGWGDVGISLHLLAPNLFALPIALFGSKGQKEQYLARFCDEKMPAATAAIVEPVYQFDPAELATTAVKNEDGYLINGVKTYVPLAPEHPFPAATDDAWAALRWGADHIGDHGGPPSFLPSWPPNLPPAP